MTGRRAEEFVAFCTDKNAKEQLKPKTFQGFNIVLFLLLKT